MKFGKYLKEMVLDDSVHAGQTFLINFDPANGTNDGDMRLIYVDKVRMGGNSKLADITLVNSTSDEPLKGKDVVPVRPLELPVSNIQELKRSSRRAAMGVDSQRDRSLLNSIFRR